MGRYGDVVNPLDEREQRWARRAALGGAMAFVAIYAVGFDEVRFVVAAAIGVAMTGLLALSARSGRRLMTGLAALMVGFGPWGFAWVLGAPFLLLSGWLLFRAKPRERPARTGSDETADEAEELEKASETVDKEPEAPRRPRRPRRRGRAMPEVVAGPRRPVANKRYTPPGGRSR